MPLFAESWSFNPERVVVYSRDEQKQEVMAREFALLDRNSVLRFFIGDVRDRDRLEFAMHGIGTVIHAAALKIVPIIEYNPTEAVATNVKGAENVVKAAIRAGVRGLSPCLLIRLSIQSIFTAQLNWQQKRYLWRLMRSLPGVRSLVSCATVMLLAAVVALFLSFGSFGLENKALPVTDVRMTRFHITLDQAIDLVLTCHEMMVGREIFIPKIPSFKIMDLVEAFDANHIITGIRPGEKINECLMTEDESRNAFDLHPYYLIRGNQGEPWVKGDGWIPLHKRHEQGVVDNRAIKRVA